VAAEKHAEHHNISVAQLNVFLPVRSLSGHFCDYNRERKGKVWLVAKKDRPHHNINLTVLTQDGLGCFFFCRPQILHFNLNLRIQIKPRESPTNLLRVNSNGWLPEHRVV
jgi:hypothetical protein